MKSSVLKWIFVQFCIFFIPVISFSQEGTLLNEVEIKSYYFPQSLLRLTSTAQLLDENEIKDQTGNSLVPLLNTVPGVRMEERSPGSYRLSLRGSLLRSPFGVRNVKIYLNDFPLTDAGGNTYLNLIDPLLIQRIEILKGPQSSFFGANTGGTILIDPVGDKPDTLLVGGGLIAGTYGQLQQNISFQTRTNNKTINIAQGYQQHDGYRDHSAMRRSYLHTAMKWNYMPRAQLRVFLMGSDMRYQTPGGLTFEQFKTNPRGARPATATLPGAEEQMAAVYNRTLFGGVANEAALSPELRHVVVLFGSLTNFQNPFITNFEIRNEKTYGARTYAEFSEVISPRLKYKINFGLEGQQTYSAISNYGNVKGEKDTIQSADDINAAHYFLFDRISIDAWNRLMIEISASFNYFYYEYRTRLPVSEAGFTRRPFAPQLMPRFAASFKITDNIVWRASISRGFSPPTIAEVRPSDRYINTFLKAETGWNYESGIKMIEKSERFWVDLCAYYFKLENTIVRRLNDEGAEFFVNAGETDQKGIEFQLNGWILRPGYSRILDGLQFNESLSINSYYFRNYQVNDEDFSGNFITGVPKFMSAQSLKFFFPSSYQLFVQHNFIEAIPLNDANSVYAEPYHLVQLKASRSKQFQHLRMEAFAGVDNLFNEKYSLGNDLNAAGGRYYNAAPGRNYFVGVNLFF